MWLRAIGISFDQSLAMKTSGGEHGPRFGGACYLRLFAQHMLASLSGKNGPMGVQAIWEWMVDRVDVRIGK
jgi:hypothetical protein